MNKTFTDKIPLILVFGLPFSGIIVSCYNAVNIPLLDDYNFVFGFLENYLNADSFSEKIYAVFAPSNHMIFATFNLIVLLDFSLFGKVDFIHFIFFNNLLHLLLLFVLFRIFQQEQITAKYFVPVALLFAAPNFAVQNWACYTAHVLGVVLTVTTIWTLNRPGQKYFCGALLLAIIAALSAGGGFLAFLAPIPILLTRYRPRDGIIWGAFFFTILFLSVYWNTTGFLAFGMSERSPTNILTYGLNLILFFGSIFKSLYQEYHIWAGIFGVLICGSLMAIFLRRFNNLKKYPLLASGLLFGLMLAALVTLTRSQYGIGATTAYRYRLYQFIPLVFIYLYILIHLVPRAQNYFWSIIGFSLLFFGFRMQHNLNKLQEQNWQLESGLRNFVVAGDFDQLSYHTPSKAGYWLREMGQKKVFDLDSEIDSGDAVLNLKRAVHFQPMELVLDSVVETEHYYQVKGWAFPSYSASESLQIYLLMETGAQRYYYPSGPLLNAQVLMGKASSGFVGLVNKDKITFDWNDAKVGVVLWHPYLGIVAERFLP